MKNYYSILHFVLALIVVICTTIPCAAFDDVEVDGIVYNVYMDHAEVIGPSNNFNGIANICSTVTFSYIDDWNSVHTVTVPVTTIKFRAFCGWSSLTNVVIPNTVTKIDNQAFKECTGLTNIEIPNSVTYIGQSAFALCEGLRRISIGCSTVTFSYIDGFGVFHGCTPKELIWNAKNCGKNGEMNTGEIEHLTIGPEVEVLPENLANGSKITEVTIPNSVTTIGNYAFYNCLGLTSIDIPNSVTTIGNYAFCNCLGLTSIDISNSVTSIGYSAFSNCSSLTSINIPNNISSISAGTYSGCSGLTDIVIPNSVTSIGNDAFFGCSGLSSLTVPNSVTYIGTYAFYGCGPKELVWNVKSCSYCYYDGDRGRMCTENIERLIIGPEVEVLPRYLADGSKITEVTIPNTVTTIGEFSFRGCFGITSIEIPNSVTTIGRYAFANCSPNELIWNAKNCISNGTMNTENIEHLSIGPEVEVLPENLASGSNITKVTIPNSVTTIGNYAFYNCSGLSSIEIPESVTSISSDSFKGCNPIELIWNAKNCVKNGKMNTETIEQLTIGPEVEVLPEYLASGSKITKVTIPNSVTTIGKCAFSNCSGLTGIIVIPDKVTTIGSNTFYGCSSMTSIVIPNKVTSIGNYAFYNCLSLTSIIIPDEVTTIGNYTFCNCSGLTGSIVIPDKVTTIGNYAFYNCLSLTSIVISSKVTTIGSNAFSYCSSVRDIYSLIKDPNSVELGSSVFYRVPKDLCVLHVPPGIEDVYREADQWKDFFIEDPEEVEMKTAFSKGFEDSFPFPSMEPEGVTADGASRMFIYFDEDIDDIKSIDLKVIVVSQETVDPAIIGDFGEFKKLPNGKWGYDYRAPEDILDIYNYRVFYTVKVMSASKGWIGYGSFIVMRPGVLLLHGFLGDDRAFEAQYKHLITEGGYYPYQVLNASYKESNAQSFDDNTYCNDVVGNRLKALFNAYATHGIISSKYDIVGHSMGGILARLYAQEVNPDAVNRIITLDTPHYGSQLADFREPILNFTISSYYSSSLAIVKDVCIKIQGFLTDPEFGAIQDLKPSSAAINKLNCKTCEGIPVLAIGSYMTCPPEETWLDIIATHNIRGKASTIMYSLMPFVEPEYRELLKRHDWGFSFMDAIYGGNNDGVVPLVSQLGGLSSSGARMQEAECIGVFGLLSKANHINTHHWDKTIDYIIESLTLPKSSDRFCKTGFRAPANVFLESGSQPLRNIPKFKDAPESSFINLALEKKEDRKLLATVTSSDDIDYFAVYAKYDDDVFLVSAWETEPTIVIPDNYEGSLVFYALGRTANDELVADIDSVEYSSITSLVALDFEDYDDLTMCVGQTLGLNVVATWDNGESEYVRPTYSATPGGILSIDGQMFTPVAVGECELIAEYKGLTCTKKINVITGKVSSNYDVNGDGNVNISDVTVLIFYVLTGSAPDIDLSASDVTGDGKVNVSDVTKLIYYVMNGAW